MGKDTGKVLIHGKEYETVASRISKFRQSYTDTYSIVTEIIEANDTIVIMKATISFEDRVIATGHAEENRTASTINRTSALENCETSAIGRALAAFGLAGTEFASADEVAQAIHQQGSNQVTRPSGGLASDKQRELIQRKLDELGINAEESKGYLIETFGVEVPLTKEGAGFVIDELLGNNK